MAKQDRAIRTRRKILEAAALVFERQGYQPTTIAEILSTAGVTKGALYFHFRSKDELAQGILAEQQAVDPALTPQAVKLQEIVDAGMVLAQRLREDTLVRASIRLTLDPQAADLDRAGPFHAWAQSNLKVLEEARRQGELLPHVSLLDTAELYVGAFAGIQQMSQVISDYEDLGHRASVMFGVTMPSIAVPAVLASLDFSTARAERLIAAVGPAVEPAVEPAADLDGPPA